jgi:PAS domain S-box-containing protein
VRCRYRVSVSSAASEQKFEGLLESAPDAIVIVDERGSIALVNHQTEQLFGYTRDELIGELVEILIPVELRETHVEHRRKYTDDPHTRPMGIGMDLLGQRKDGSRFPVEISLSPLRTDEGLLITAVVRDITERKNAERALRESERRFRELIEGTDDLVVRLDHEGHFIYLNHTAERVFGLPPQECAGRSWFDFVHPEDRPETIAAFRGWAAERVGGTTFENRQLSGEGRVSHILWTVNPRYDSDGRLTSVTAIGRDITDRKRLEQAERAAEMRQEVLRRSITAQEEERRRIAREIHDEAGQSLTGVLLGLGRIESAQALESASAEAARLGAQVSDALGELRQIATRLRPTILDDLGLVPALEQLAGEAPAAAGTEVRLEHSSLDRLEPQVETAIYRVVQEALTNAAKYANASKIRIALRQRDGALTATIEDDGRGFDPEFGSGDGLGLTGMRERAELVGGNLSVSSAPGEGTQIVLTVPVGR